MHGKGIYQWDIQEPNLTAIIYQEEKDFSFNLCPWTAPSLSYSVSRMTAMVYIQKGYSITYK